MDLIVRVIEHSFGDTLVADRYRASSPASGGGAYRMKDEPMRVLVATTANAGHFGPLVPFAQACAAEGHDVRVAAPASFAHAVNRAELEHLAVDDPAPGEQAAVFDRLPQLSLEEANAVVMRDVFAGIDARAALPRLAAASLKFRPDLILRETAEFASYVVAETQQVPHVQVAIGLATLDAFAHPLIDNALRRARGGPRRRRAEGSGKAEPRTAGPG